MFSFFQGHLKQFKTNQQFKLWSRMMTAKNNLIQLTLQRMNNEEEEEAEKPCNACRSMIQESKQKTHDFGMVLWIQSKISKRRASEISIVLRSPAFKICDPVKTNSKDFSESVYLSVKEMKLLEESRILVVWRAKQLLHWGIRAVGGGREIEIRRRV